MPGPFYLPDEPSTQANVLNLIQIENGPHLLKQEMICLNFKVNRFMTDSPETPPTSTAAIGVISAATAFLIWGASPIYWKLLRDVPALEILIHRIVWSFIFLAPLVLIRGRQELISTLRDRFNLMMLGGSTLMVALNWLIYIWAVTHDQVLQASLGYFICPLVNVLLGVIFLRERLRRVQMMAVVLAAMGVFYLTIHFGHVPWVALSLAISFGLYGLIRKTIATGALVGLTVETLLLFIPAAVYLFYLDRIGAGFFWRDGWRVSMILIGTILPTAPPLLLFTFGARRLNLSTVGILQYIMPSSAFILAVFLYQEPFERAQLLTFITIWIALVIFSIDSMATGQRIAREDH
jgi:chloramphenicol-sensitive protein RarD